jgi:hypothetical protein
LKRRKIHTTKMDLIIDYNQRPSYVSKVYMGIPDSDK